MLHVEADTRRILATSFGRGSEHDFTIFKRTFERPQSEFVFTEETECLADLGYLGIDTYHAASYVPHKKPKVHELTDEQKEENRELAGERVAVEHVIGRLKTLKILSE